MIRQAQFFVLCGMMPLTACGGVAESDQAVTTAELPATFEVKGRTFLRRDLWSVDDLERIKYEGRPDLASDSAPVLAAQLRAQTRRGNAVYIELEPDLELAKRILAGEARQGTPQGLPREARDVQGRDNRTRSLFRGAPIARERGRHGLEARGGCPAGRAPV